MNGSRRVGLGLALALGALACGVPAVRDALADGEVVRPRVNLSPSYHAGDQFRVVRNFRQRTVTGQSVPRGRPVGPVNPSTYDASINVSALVTVDSTSPAGEPEVWTARLETFTYDLPEPLQSKEYRDRRRERKAKNLSEDAHPLEGAIVKVDESGPKTKVYRETESGKDYAITTRYPELLPLMQELVEPDWIPVDAIPLGGDWEMNADHIFRFTRVLMRAPLRGTILCNLSNVTNDIATINFRSKLKNNYANVDMEIVVSGTITFDLGHRRPASTSYTGEVQISSPGSSLTGIGKVDGGTTVSPITATSEATPASAK
jgi:hypothetical protein